MDVDWFELAKDIANAPTMYDKLSIARDDVMGRIAERLGKPRKDLVAWVDYDPIQVDEDVQRAVKGPYRYAGD